YIPPEDEVFPVEEQPLLVVASPTTDSPGYILEYDPDEDPKDDDDEDPKEDPADYPTNHDDDEEEEEEPSRDDDDEEEEHSASADSIPPPPVLRVTARISFRPQPSTLSFTKEDAERRRIAEDIVYGIRDAWIDPRDVAEEEALTTLEGVNTRVTELAAVQEQDTQDIYGVIEDAQGR
nr:hypothetical protein [Tanacetum cinerariifolium]